MNIFIDILTNIITCYVLFEAWMQSKSLLHVFMTFVINTLLIMIYVGISYDISDKHIEELMKENKLRDFPFAIACSIISLIYALYF